MESAIQSVREAHEAELETERQRRKEKQGYMEDHIKFLDGTIGLLTNMLGSMQEQIKMLIEVNKSKTANIDILTENTVNLTKGKDYRTLFNH